MIGKKKQQMYKELGQKSKKDMLRAFGFSEKDINKIYKAERLYMRVYRAKNHPEDIIECAENR